MQGSPSARGGRGPRQRSLCHLADVPLQLLTGVAQVLALLPQLVPRLLQLLIGGHIGLALLVQPLPLSLRVLRVPGGCWGILGQNTAASQARPQIPVPVSSPYCRPALGAGVEPHFLVTPTSAEGTSWSHRTGKTQGLGSQGDTSWSPGQPHIRGSLGHPSARLKIPWHGLLREGRTGPIRDVPGVQRRPSAPQTHPQQGPGHNSQMEASGAPCHSAQSLCLWSLAAGMNFLDVNVHLCGPAHNT